MTDIIMNMSYFATNFSISYVPNNLQGSHMETVT